MLVQYGIAYTPHRDVFRPKVHMLFCLKYNVLLLAALKSLLLDEGQVLK